MNIIKKLSFKNILFFLVLGGGIYYLWSVNSVPEELDYNYLTATKKDLLQKVSANGQVLASQTADLAFEKSGKITRVHAKVGNTAKRGDILVELAGDDLWADLLDAQAVVEREKAELSELEQGAKIEEIEIYQARIKKSEASFVNAKQHFLQKLHEIYTQVDDLIHNKVDIIFQQPRVHPQLNFSTKNAVLKNDVLEQRKDISVLLKEWDTYITHLWEESDFQSYTVKTRTNLKQIQTFLDDLAFLINDLSTESNLSQATIDLWKDNVSVARSTLHTIQSELTQAKDSLNISEASLFQDYKELNLKESSATPQKITVYGAEVKSAEARLNRVYAQLSKNLIKAPFDGTVIRNEATVGEIVLPEMVMVSLIGEGLEIKANVPEIDIAKVHLSDEVEITFDALEDRTYTGKVSAINPAGTTIQGVVYYETTVLFENKDDLSGIKPGMTADLEILTNRKNDVLAVPQRSVITKNGKKFLKILLETIDAKGQIITTVEEKEVIIGMKGSDGEIEIQEGLKEGDKVVVSLNGT